MNGKLRFLLGFGLFFVALWFLWDTPVIYPLKIFVVLLHETSHAIAALATGGYVQRIVLDPYQGGACYCPGGNAFVTLTAGYLGSLMWGGLILLAARSKRIRPGLLTTVLGAVTVGLTLLYVRSGFGIAFGLGFATGGGDLATRSVMGLGTGQRNLSAAFVVAVQNFADDGDVVRIPRRIP